MARLLHEIWEEDAADGMTYTCCLVGAMGDGCRRRLGPNARLLRTFEADSHFEAMTLYNQFLGWEPYSTDQPLDYEPYAEAWRAAQKNS